jgi:hypothetical protein
MKNGLRNRPFGTRACSTPTPALKRWAILVSSLRDDSVQILVALGEDARRYKRCHLNWWTNEYGIAKGLLRNQPIEHAFLRFRNNHFVL